MKKFLLNCQLLSFFIRINMKQLDRIEKIYSQLRKKELCYEDIALFFKTIKYLIN